MGTSVLTRTNVCTDHLQTFCQVPNGDFVFVTNLGEVDVTSVVGHSSEAGAVQEGSRGPRPLSVGDIPDFEG
jgi:hypothetical protein